MASLASAPAFPPPHESAFNGVVMRNDVLEVMVADDAGNVTFEPCCVWNVLDAGFDVIFLYRSKKDQLVWEYSSEVQSVPWESVNLHLTLSNFEGNSTEERQKRAFRQLGFRLLGEGRFYKITEENTVSEALPLREAHIGNMDTSDEESGLDSDEDCDCELESLDGDGNLKDLVTPDEDCELWTAADGAFAVETHRAVAAFDAHVPTTERQLRVRDAIDRLETKIRREEQERAWSRRRDM